MSPDDLKPGAAAKGAEARRVHVALAHRSYDVHIGPGLLASAPGLIEAVLGPSRCGIVTDENVAARHLAPLEAGLAAAGRHAGSIVLPPGEGTKSFAQLDRVCQQLLELGLERGDAVIAVGGGVIGDLAGFAASILRRGVRYVQVPTTLLAQVDSSVGGKTGINTPQGKNLVGAFHQPSLVLADTDVLATLPARQMRAGYAEIAKYGLLGDAELFYWLEANWQRLFRHETPALIAAITRSVEMKAEIVARDETETGDRALLNLGHTFGHALEAWTGYSDRLLHGEAVSIGMCLAIRLSEELEHCPPQMAARVAGHLKAVGLATSIRDISGPGGMPGPQDLLRLMRQDKKVQGGRLTLILVRDIGQAFAARDVDPARLLELLDRAALIEPGGP
ncbi:MAG: 3-dehydroquinate synthase [Hyphomicrobiaceae bacterium]|nr:3-dehydroquinate synthase [Hyphomicrobiaceae bacterium]